MGGERGERGEGGGGKRRERGEGERVTCIEQHTHQETKKHKQTHKYISRVVYSQQQGVWPPCVCPSCPQYNSVVSTSPLGTHQYDQGTLH